MKQKRLILTLILIVAFLALSGCNGFSEAGTVSLRIQLNNPNMTVNGTVQELDPGRGTTPILSHDRILVPLRGVTEAMGGTVEWNEATQTATLTCNGNTVSVTVGSDTALHGGVPVQLDAAAEINNDRIMVPLRFEAESFAYRVAWDAESQTALITDYPLLTVYFLDVGQGDSAYAELPNGETMLIDAGPDKKQVSETLSAHGKTNLTYVIATHPDADHIGGMSAVINGSKIDKFYMPDKSHTSKTFETMLDSLSENGCKVIRAETGVSMIDSGSLQGAFMAPVREYQDNNNASAVLRLVYKNASFLFDGDAETESETDMLGTGENLRADILKVAHHGSKTSTSPAFLDAVQPKTAIISVGAGNTYGHPKQETLDRLSDYGCNIYRTDTGGTVCVTTDGEDYYIERKDLN